jgi:copper chaperone
MEQATLNVNGMSCGHCVNSIEGNVGKLNGVTTVKVNLNEGTVDLTFDPNSTSLKEITEVIEEQGYDVGKPVEQGKSCH